MSFPITVNGTFSHCWWGLNVLQDKYLHQDNEMTLLYQPVWRWWWWIVFVVWLTDERRLALFPAGAIVIDLTIANLQPAASGVRTCAEPEFRRSWMKFCSSDNHYTMSAKVTCFSDLPPTGLQNPIHLLHQYLGSAANLPLKPIHFLCIQDWHPSEKIEILPTPLQHTPQGCFPESVSECRFLPQIIILVFPMFTLRPLASILWLRSFFSINPICRVFHPYCQQLLLLGRQQKFPWATSFEFVRQCFQDDDE